MLATPGALPDGPDWLFEVKWDGLRVLAEIVEDTLRLTTRTGRDVTAHFPELAGLVALGPDALLDGEVIRLERGVPSFGALAERLHGPIPAAAALARPVTFMAFDVLRLYGVELLARPLVERRGTLERLDTEAVATLEVSPAYTDGGALLAVTAQQGMEGVVAKRRTSTYLPGRRSPDWVTTTHRRSQACVVGGRRPERGAPARSAALLLGVPDARGLRYVGTVDVGLGSDAAQRALAPVLVAAVAPPFADTVSRADATDVGWCAPSTVVEVSHLGWTAEGRLRQPVFRGVRDDLDAAAVEREP